MGVDSADLNVQNEYMLRVAEGAIYIGSRFFNPLYHFEFLWNIFGYKKQLNDVVTYGFGHIRKILEKKKQLIKEQKADSSNNKNFLSYLLKVTEEEGIWTDKEMMEETQTMVCAGSDTTALTMSFATIMLALHQDIQQKLYKEVYDIFGDSDRDATLDDLTRMEYTERVIRETMRLFPVGPCQFREVLEDIKIRDVVIPEGSQLLIPVHFIHRNPKYWPDPLKFNPDRFLPEEVEKRPRYSYMPFSIPPRNCIGKTFAMMSMKVSLTNMMRNFRIVSTQHKSIETMKLHINVLISSANGYGVLPKMFMVMWWCPIMLKPQTTIDSQWPNYAIPEDATPNVHRNNSLEMCFTYPQWIFLSIVVAVLLVKTRIHRDGNVLGLPPKNLRTEGVEAINRGNQRQSEDFSRPFAGGVVSVPGESQGDSDRVNLQGRRDDVVEFTRAVGDDSSKYHRPHRQADHGLHYGRLQTERFCGSGSRRVLSVQVVPGLTGRCRIYPPAREDSGQEREGMPKWPKASSKREREEGRMSEEGLNPFRKSSRTERSPSRGEERNQSKEMDKEMKTTMIREMREEIKTLRKELAAVREENGELRKELATVREEMRGREEKGQLEKADWMKRMEMIEEKMEQREKKERKNNRGGVEEWLEREIGVKVNVKEAFKINKDKMMLAKIENWEQKKNIMLSKTGCRGGDEERENRNGKEGEEREKVQEVTRGQ
ncbi:hypothetical protein GEV33_013456 [Tenebrio molitor]|uniref:Cytochrome P450 monooxygenase n=1 Tax=Tenebrio molitor TaxID=7067 RepID=A0A8J6H057_TENMO|nr:hypothetical protein GEV33_013456 [Tenebrio molitor]